jgi:hypothetical protein
MSVAAARELMGQDEPARAARAFWSALSRWRGVPLDGMEAVCVAQAAEQFTELLTCSELRAEHTPSRVARPIQDVE